MSTDQTTFTATILDPARAVPNGLTDPEGRPAGKRFDVYRNNVVVSLTEALITAFPIVHKLVGDRFFRSLAGVYVRAHPPTSPLMMFYGEAMPAFLAGFEPAAHLGYLPDVARLELAQRRAYHAADAAPIDPTALQELPPDRLMGARLVLAPAVQVVRSDWPIHAIWRFNTQENAPKPAMQAEDVLITRPEFDPVTSLLPPGGASFLDGLGAGDSFADALNKATEIDLAAMLGLLLSGGAIIKISEGTDQ